MNEQPSSAELMDLLQHVVWVLRDKAPGEIERCVMCRTAAELVDREASQ